MQSALRGAFPEIFAAADPSLPRPQSSSGSQRPPQIAAARWAELLGILCLEDPIHHDGPMELPSGAVIAAQRAVARGEAGDLDELHRLILQALWRDDRDIASLGAMAEPVTAAGLRPPRPLLPAPGGPGSAQW